MWTRLNFRCETNFLLEVAVYTKKKNHYCYQIKPNKKQNKTNRNKQIKTTKIKQQKPQNPTSLFSFNSSKILVQLEKFFFYNKKKQIIINFKKQKL